MKVIGFSITEIHAKKEIELKRPSVNTDIMFESIDKAAIDVLKEGESLKTSFKFSISYKETEKKDSPMNEVIFKGYLLLNVTKDESKEFLKSWKTKEVPKDKVLPLYNFILRKCSVRALQLEEELNLPLHVPFPQIRNQPEEK